MGIWSKITGEFIDIIEWLDNTQDTMVYRFERHENEIKNGAQLIVRESQVAVFVNEGQIADTFQPGTYTLATQNLPILSTLKGWKYGFNSPFKAEVYFINTKNFTDNKWGTKNPIMLRDAEFGPIRLRAFGSYTIKVTDAPKFLKEVVGTNAEFTTDQVTDQLRNLVVTRFTDIIGESKIPALDMAGNYNEFSKYIKEQIKDDFNEYGIEVTKVLVENISLPPEVEAALDKRSSMGVLGNLDQYMKYQGGQALGNMGNNPDGGNLGNLVGVGVGLNVLNNMVGGQQVNQNQTPPPPPPAIVFHVAVNGQQTGPFNLQQLQQMLQAGQFNQQSLVWSQGMAGWTAAGQVSQLSGVFSSMPPPLPPPIG
ncbi:MAG: SPFH domain-containing protein [Cytophagales bacterium]|nr:MAG: SPFH domain-containing protein [Cytophagales bacterium]